MGDRETEGQKMETEERSLKMGQRSRRSALFLALLFLAWDVKSATGKEELATLFSDTAETLLREAKETPKRAKRSTTGSACHGFVDLNKSESAKLKSSSRPRRHWVVLHSWV